MGGTLEWIDEKIECPECLRKNTVSICVDSDPKITPETVTGIAGGTHKCKCGCEITDNDRGNQNENS